ncbi:MAG: class I SAM-dependent methyltransferase [Okeania sp. SIO3B5]|uniref:class I SAM-dependent methyltransferase n=1 Tax=Okeania sp. SIO3B5 TaxID=2607811 RepID=UPI0013FEE31C|nr:class I SAM-dependent methyltransferase [Okeania sp. SIO3B5]NEO56776.1 class I SAM-dependent methyltransferase [Okeania sp. SIO3B5]
MFTKISAEEFYNNHAAKYDYIVKTPNAQVQYLNEAVKIFQQRNYHQGSVLDIGCGTGLLSELLQGDFEYTGIDISVNMLGYATQRGYKTIHKPIEKALVEIDSHSYDFVFCLGSLYFVEDAQTAIEHIYRIARKTILISLTEATDEYIKNHVIPVYDHSKMVIKNAMEDYFILGWTPPNTGIPIRTRMIYIEQKN